jgi:chromosome segregation ATPase
MADGQVLEKELEESRKRIESLEKEKSEMAEKSKGLADIIESLSDQKPDTGDIEAVIGTHLKDLGERFEAKIKKLEEGSAAKDMEVKKQVASLMKEKMDPKLGEISDKLKDLDKIKDLGDRIAQINERLSSPLYQPKQPGAVSQGLASFGEQIDFESELNDVRKAIDTINMSLANMSKKVEYRLSSAEDKLKELDKLKALEIEFREINDKLGTENVQKLKKLVFSAEEMMDEVIPETVNRKLKKRIEPIVNSLKANRDFSNDLQRKIADLDSEVRELRKFKDTITELRLEKDKLYKKFAEEEARFLQGLEILKMNIRKKLEKTVEKYQDQLTKMQEFASPKTIETSVKDVMMELLENRLQGMEKHLMLLDEKARALTEKDRDILSQVEEMEAPENLRKWIADQTKDIERKVFYDLQGLKKEAEKGRDSIASIKERQKTYEASMAEFSRKMSEQASTTNKVIDLKDVFAKRADSLAASIKSQDTRIDGDKERVVALEQSFRDIESRFDKISDNIEGIGKIISEMKPLKERLAEAEATMKVMGRKLADKDTLAAQVRKMEMEIASMHEKQSSLEAQLAADRTRAESMLAQTTMERRHVEEKIKKEKMKVSELLRELKT